MFKTIRQYFNKIENTVFIYNYLLFLTVCGALLDMYKTNHIDGWAVITILICFLAFKYGELMQIFKKKSLK